MSVPVIHDPSELFEEDVLTDGQVTIDWSDVDRPESLPENEKEAKIDLAEWMIRTGGVRSGFGHHEEVRRSMQEWAPNRDEDDPNGYRRTVYQMGPAERNGRALRPEVEDPEKNPEQALEDRLQKADTILAWARSEFPDDVYEVRKDEWVENAWDKWESEIQDAIRVAQAEAFAADPPAEYNGWERFESDKPDVELAYRAEVYGDPVVAAVYEKEGIGEDAAEFRMDEWQEAETANEAGVNRVLFDPTNEPPAAGDLEKHLRQFDADPLTYDPTQEFTDDRPDQDTLGTADATQHREPKVAEGSDEFADDRDHDEPEGDGSSQASLGAETIEGQADLTGGQAAKGPEWATVEDQPIESTPAGWSVEAVDGDRIELDGPEGVTAEVWESDRGWDAEYTLNETRRDGTDQFHDTAESALESMAEHIEEVLEEQADREAQEKEQGAVEWPEELAGFDLYHATATPTHAEYNIRYLKDKTVLGKQYGQDQIKIRFYDDTRQYHVSIGSGPILDTGEAFDRKQPAIDYAREQAEKLTEKYEEIEADAREEIGDQDAGQEFDGEERGRIKHFAEQGDMERLASVIDVPQGVTMGAWMDTIPTPRAMVEWYDERGDFQDIQGVGPTRSEHFEAAVPHVREAIEDQDDGERFKTGDDGYPEVPEEVGPFERHETPPGRYKWATNQGPHVSVHVQKGGLGGTWSGHAVRDGDRVATWNRDYTVREMLEKAVDFMESYDPEGTDQDGRDVPESVNGWSRYESAELNGGDFDVIVWRDQGGDGPRWVSIRETEEGTYHVDHTNQDWEDSTTWITDQEARDEDRVRDGVPFQEAVDAATGWMMDHPGNVDSSTPYDPTDEWGPTMDEPVPVEDRAGHEDPPEVLGEGWQDWLRGDGPGPYDNLTLEEELEEAGLSGEDLFGEPEDDLEDDEPEDVTIPESVAGWDLAAEEDGFYSWIGDGGTPPAAFDRDETVAKVTAQSHGGRWKHRWSTKVRFEGPAGPDDEERSTQKTIHSHKLTRSTEDKGYAVNRARAIESAVDWMRDNPSTMGSPVEENESSTESENADRETLTVKFGDVDLARDWYENLPTAAHTGQYDRRHKTLEVFVDEVDERSLERMQADAADSRLHETQKFGQEEITDAELEALKERDSWNHRKLFTAQSVKALFLGHGIGNWMDYYDPSLTTDEHRAIAREQAGGRQKPDELQRAGSPARHGGNETRDRDPDDPEVVRERVKSTMRALGQECDHALNWCEEGDDEACAFLVEECDWTESEVEGLARQVEEAEQKMDQLYIDDGGRIDPGTAIEMSDLPVAGGGEIPGFAKGTLKRAWTGYELAVQQAAKDREAAVQFERHRAEAERYAQIVNEVRDRFGQDPLSFERLEELNAVAPIEPTAAPTNETNSTGFEAVVEWSQQTLSRVTSQQPYDPMKEFETDRTGLPEGEFGDDGPTDLEKARELHSARSEQAQEMDESIQARDQVTDFGTWSEAPNMMDFVGVDDLEIGLLAPDDS